MYEEVIAIPNLDENVRRKEIEILFANNATKFLLLKKIPLEKDDFVLKSMPRDL